MGSLFSSPGKQASQAASAAGNIADSEINKLLGYTDSHQQQLRGAIAGMGDNPYFSAAQQLNPQAYYVNPHDTTSFSAGGPGSGLTPGSAAVAGSAAPPAPPNVIMSGPTSGIGNPFTPPTGPPTTPPSHPGPTPGPPGGVHPLPPVPGGGGYQGPPGVRPIIPPRERL